VEGYAECGIIVCHSLIDFQDFLELAGVAAVAGFLLTDGFVSGATHFLQTSGLLFLEGSTLLKETGKVLYPAIQLPVKTNFH